MSITNENFLYRLESLLGESYEALMRQTDRHDPSTACHALSKAKNMIRGGFDYLYGPIPPDPITGVSLESGVVTLNNTQKNLVSISTVSVLIHGQEHTIRAGSYSPGFLSSNNTSVEQVISTLHPLFYSAIIGVMDTSRLGVKSATISSVKFGLRSQKSPPSNERWYAIEHTPPSYPREYFVPLAVANVTATYVYPTHSLHFAAPAYDPPIGDDDQVVDLFGPLNSLEDLVEGMDVSSKYRPSLDAISNFTRFLTSLDFKEYWKSKRFKHHDSFRKLYAKVYGTDIGVELASHMNPATVSLTMEQMYAPGNVELVTMKEIPPTANVAQAELYLCNNRPKLKLAGWVHPGDATMMVWGTHADWPQSGYLFVRDSYAKTRVLATYAKTGRQDVFLVGTLMVSASVGPWVDIYNVDKVTAVMGTGMPTYARTVVEGKYVMLVGATLVNSPLPDSSFIVRSS